MNKESWYGRRQRTLKYFYLKVVRTKAPAHDVAMGVACGVFGGCLPALPPIPLQTAVAVLLAVILRGSKVPAIVCTWVSNPLNWLFFYWIQFKIGSWVLHIHMRFHPREMSFHDYMAVGWKGLLVLVTGGALLGIPCAAIAYFVAKPLIRGYRRRRALAILRKRTRI